MALPTSGTISLADIQDEFGGPSAPISLGNYYAGGGNVPAGTSGTNGAVPASGTLGLYHFYGTTKSTDPTVGLYYGMGRVTRLNASGALLGTATAIGTSRFSSGGAKCGSNACFYAGGITDPYGEMINNNRVSLITPSGALAQAETSVGSIRYGLAGALAGTTSTFHGGYNTATMATTTRISTTGALIGSETVVGTARDSHSGANIGTSAVFYGGYITARVNTVTLINSSGALVQAQTTVGTARYMTAGATAGTVGVYYAGYSTARVNTCTRLSTTGALVGSETAVGTARTQLGGAQIGANAVYQGGGTTAAVATRTIINANGAIVGTEAAIGTAQSSHVGAGV